jgi:protein-tyrosine phosphatase
MTKILFVCLGNICRSPLAEGLANKIAKELGIHDGLSFDSCGTSQYHIGHQPDSRTLLNAKNNGLLLSHQARQFEKTDFRDFDYILLMDKDNLTNINKLDQTNKFAQKLHLMRKYDPIESGGDVPDPYFGGEEGFQNVYDILERSIQNFIETEFH